MPQPGKTPALLDLLGAEAGSFLVFTRTGHSTRVRVGANGTFAVQLAAVHEPFGEMLKVVLAVTSPRLLLNWSHAVAV